MDNMEEKKENLIQVDLREIMETSFLDYSMSVIVQRALPDVRDGLKPVHRRILYTMYENALWPEKAYRKCADTVGSVLGRYHPHGDASVYDALVRLAQDFSMRYMLIDGHGNFGSVDGDPPAAYRYTEARMSKLSVEMLKDIDERQYLAATGIVTVTDDLVIRIVGRDNELQRTVRIGIFQVQAKQVKRIINRELFGQVLQIERIITGLRLT